MKRSEMIQILQTVIYDSMGQMGEFDLAQSEYVLNKLEEAGMLPPLHPDLFCFECDDGSPMRIWEKE